MVRRRYLPCISTQYSPSSHAPINVNCNRKSRFSCTIILFIYFTLKSIKVLLISNVQNYYLNYIVTSHHELLICAHIFYPDLKLIKNYFSKLLFNYNINLLILIVVS